MPKVSIVLPTYNGEKYIRESIDSIIEQTFTDWELIIVNDCATDCTPQIVREYEKKDERIRVIDNLENKKLPESLNVGFRNATGEYMTWTSDDNIYLPNAIEKMVDYLEEDIYCFADRDEKKIGRKIGDKIIVSLADMKQLSELHHIVVAADIQNIYNFLMTLDELNVENCSVFIP